MTENKIYLAGKQWTEDELAKKVSTRTGYDLSKNDFTDALKGKLDGIEETAQVNLIEAVQVNGTAVAISNKTVNIPVATKDAFGAVKVGAGISVSNGVISADTQFKFQIFEALPTAGETYAQTIALIANQGAGENIYNEYGCVQVDNVWQWELFGTTAFELDIQQGATGITINNTALQAATDAQTGLLTAADHATFAGKQDALTFDNAPAAGSDNPVKSSGIFTALAGKVDVETGKSLVEDTKVAGYDAHLVNADVHVTAAQKDAWTGKQNKLTGTAGNVVTYTETDGTLGSIGFDAAPTASSTNLVKSGAIKAALDDKVDLASGSSAFTIGRDSTGIYYVFNE